jgi:hypothetical protein
MLLGARVSANLFHRSSRVGFEGLMIDDHAPPSLGYCCLAKAEYVYGCNDIKEEDERFVIEKAFRVSVSTLALLIDRLVSCVNRFNSFCQLVSANLSYDEVNASTKKLTRKAPGLKAFSAIRFN